MKCRKSLSELFQNETGTLDREAQATWFEHISVCNECRSRVRTIRRTMSELGHAFDVPVPPGFVDMVMLKVGGLAEPVRARVPQGTWVSLCSATVAVGLLFGAVMLMVQPKVALLDYGLLGGYTLEELTSSIKPLEAWRVIYSGGKL